MSSPETSNHITNDLQKADLTPAEKAPYRIWITDSSKVFNYPYG